MPNTLSFNRKISGLSMNILKRALTRKELKELLNRYMETKKKMAIERIERGWKL